MIKTHQNKRWLSEKIFNSVFVINLFCTPQNLTLSTHFGRIFVLSTGCTGTTPWRGFSSLSFIRIIGCWANHHNSMIQGVVAFMFFPIFRTKKEDFVQQKRTFFKLRMTTLQWMRNQSYELLTRHCLLLPLRPKRLPQVFVSTRQCTDH